MRTKLSTEARELLRDAAYALEAKCDAAGPEETEEHPDLREHAKIAARIRKYLARKVTG